MSLKSVKCQVDKQFNVITVVGFFSSYAWYLFGISISDFLNTSIDIRLEIGKMESEQHYIFSTLIHIRNPYAFYHSSSGSTTDPREEALCSDPDDTLENYCFVIMSTRIHESLQRAARHPEW